MTAVAIVRRALATGLTRAPRWLAALVAVNLALAVLPILSVSITQSIVAAATRRSLDAALGFVVLQALVMAGQALGQQSQSVASRMYHTLVAYPADRGMALKVAADGPERLEDPAVAVSLTRARATAGGAALTAPVTAGLRLSRDVIQVVGMLGFLAAASVWAAAAALAVTVPIAAIHVATARRKYLYDKGTARVSMASNYWRGAITRESLPELLGTGGIRHVMGQWERAFDADRRTILSSLTIELAGIVRSEGVMAAAYAAVGVLLMRATIPGRLPDLVAGLQAIGYITAVAASQGHTLSQLGDGIWRLGEAAPWMWPAGATSVDVCDGNPVNFNVLEARAVTYQYPSRTVPAIKGVTATLRRGRLVALVGHNGAGKTTFVRCLLGHLQPQRGEICVDGAPLSIGANWYATAGYIPQRLTALEMTLRQYLTLGREVSDARLLEVLKDVGAKWVKSLDQPLGFTAHAGTQITPGQRQQLALARTILRPGAGLVAMDEPYNGVDPATGARLLALCRELAQDRLVLVVAHRAAVADIADQVLWFQDGQLTADASPGLLGENPAYRAFWHRQDNANVSVGD